MAARNREMLVSRPAKLDILINKGVENYVSAYKEPLWLGTMQCSDYR
jgi:hypothetical protein